MGGIGLGLAGITARNADATALTASDTSAIRGLMEEFFQERVSRLCASPVRIDSSASSMTTRNLARSLKDRNELFELRRLAINETHGGYVAGHPSLSIDITSAERSRLKLSILEHTTLTYSAGPADPAEYSTRHTAFLVRTNSEWAIDQVSSDEEFICFAPPTVLPMDMTNTAPHPRTPHVPDLRFEIEQKDSPSPRRRDDDDGIITPFATGKKGYNYSAMVLYAGRNWSGLGDHNYAHWGSDCTSFISACMRAGGWQLVTGRYSERSAVGKWWYSGLLASSYSWAASQNWRNFAFSAKRVIAMSHAWKMLAGDVLGYDFDGDGSLDHLQICYNPNHGDPLMTQRSSGNGSGAYHRKKLSEILSNSSNKAAVKYVHGT